MNAERTLVVYRDSDTLPNLVLTINELCGATVQNTQRLDLSGEYVIADILSVDVTRIGESYAAVVIASIRPVASDVVQMTFSASARLPEVGTIDNNGNYHPMPYIPGISGIER